MNRRWWRTWWTAHQLRLLLLYGTCPACRSSPPRPDCPACAGSHHYGPRISSTDRTLWAARYIADRS